MTLTMNQLTGAIIAAAIEVHKHLGPGLLESSYMACMCRELQLRGIPFEKQVPLPIVYKGIALDCGYKVDILVDNRVVLELKAIDKIDRIHEAQLLTYLRLGNWQLGLLMNFNVAVLKDGIKRRVLGMPAL